MEEPRRRTETVAFFKLFITTDAGVRLVSLQLSLIGRARAQTGILLAVCLQHFLRVFFFNDTAKRLRPSQRAAEIITVNESSQEPSAASPVLSSR